MDDDYVLVHVHVMPWWCMHWVGGDRLVFPRLLDGPHGVGGRAGDAIFDAAFGVTTLDAEVTSLAPVRVPRVGNLPVWAAGWVDAPADELDGVAAHHLARRVVVDTAGVVLEVGVDGERGLDWAAFHDHLLDGLLARGGLDLALEGVLGVGEGVWLARVARLRALGRLLGLAARGVFGRVRVFAHRAVVVAVGEGEVGASRFAEWAGTFVLAAGDGTTVLDVVPWGVDLATLASVRVGAEADGLGGDRHLEFALGGNAHAVGSGFGAAKGPAAAAVGLVTDIAEDLGARWPVGFGVEGVWDRGRGVLWVELVDLAAHDEGLQVRAGVTEDTAQRLGGARGEVGETRLWGGMPRGTGEVDLFDLRRSNADHSGER